ncbi:MAG: DUF6134 family protein [Pseudomonadota bacterium]
MRYSLTIMTAASALALGACGTATETEAPSETTASLNESQLEQLSDDNIQPAAFRTEAATSSSSTTTDMTSSTDKKTDETDTEGSTSEAVEANIENDGTFPWTPQDGDVMDFKVLRKGNDFGTHKISFSGNADGEMKVRSEVSLRAGLGPITAFKYTLDTTETWQDGTLIGLSGTTNDDGDDLTVEATKDGDQLKVSGTEFNGAVPLGILPSSHWHMGQINAEKILSTEDGEILEVTSEKVGTEDVTIGGETVSADRYLLKSDIDLDLWYDTENRLVKLAFEARGQSIEYVLSDLY